MCKKDLSRFKTYYVGPTAPMSMKYDSIIHMQSVETETKQFNAIADILQMHLPNAYAGPAAPPSFHNITAFKNIDDGEKLVIQKKPKNKNVVFAKKPKLSLNYNS